MLCDRNKMLGDRNKMLGERKKPRRWWLAPALAATLAPAGCSYGPVSKPTYEYAQALYTLSSMQKGERVDEFCQRIDAAVAAGEIPPHEAAWLRDMCDHCRAGRWQDARSAARSLIEDQIEG